MDSPEPKMGGRSATLLKRISPVFTVAAIIYPLIYGFIALSTEHPFTVPDRLYLYTIKPLQMVLLTATYVFLVYRAISSLSLRFPKARLLLFPILALSVVPMILLSFTEIYKYVGIIGPEGSIEKSPRLCLYFSVVTWTTLGYGDYRPANDDGRLFASGEAMLGYLVMGIFVGAVTQSLYDFRQMSQDRDKGHR